MPTLTKIRPCFWFDTEAEEAATFYTGIFENSRISSGPSSPTAEQKAHAA